MIGEGGESGENGSRESFLHKLGNKSKKTEVVSVGSAENEEQERHEILMQIAKKGMELTLNPQTDIEPTDLLGQEGFITDRRTYVKQLKHPKLFNDKQINWAIQLNWWDGGQTSFVVVKDANGNKASIRMNEGTTGIAGGLFNKVNVGEGHQELVVDVVREGINSTDSRKRYFEERFAVGGVPGKGVDQRVSKVVQVAHADKKGFKHQAKNFGFITALSDLPPLLLSKQGGERREAMVEDLRAILNILETGKIDTEEMSRAIIKKGNLLLTNQQYDKKFRGNDSELPGSTE